MGRVAVGRLVISTVGVALALELGSSPHPSLPFTPCRPLTLLKHNVTYGNDKVSGTILGGRFKAMALQAIFIPSVHSLLAHPILYY